MVQNVKEIYADNDGRLIVIEFEVQNVVFRLINVYASNIANATRAELIQDGNGISKAAVGVPFPVPKTGLEAIWNHLLRYRGEQVAREGGQAAPTASGAAT